MAYRFLISVLLAMQLVVLHRVDGGDVTVNADQVTSLRTPVEELHKTHPSAHCLVGLTDGKYVAVMETCTEVRQKLQNLKDEPEH